jgi:hypothetical protein
MIDQKHGGMHRRAFFASIGGVATAAALSSAAATKYDIGKPERDRNGAYQPNSDHVKAFYRTNGYETLKK